MLSAVGRLRQGCSSGSALWARGPPSIWNHYGSALPGSQFTAPNRPTCFSVQELSPDLGRELLAGCQPGAHLVFSGAEQRRRLAAQLPDQGEMPRQAGLDQIGRDGLGGFGLRSFEVGPGTQAQ